MNASSRLDSQSSPDRTVKKSPLKKSEEQSNGNMLSITMGKIKKNKKLFGGNTDSNVKSIQSSYESSDKKLGQISKGAQSQNNGESQKDQEQEKSDNKESVSDE